MRAGLVPERGRIAVEQLQFVLINAPALFLSGAVVNVIMAAVLALTAPAVPLIVWMVACWLPVALMLYLARRFLKSPQPLAEVQRSTGYCIAVFVALGVLRGVLPWIAFDNASPLVIALVLCFVAGMQSASMTVLAPVRAMFVGYTIPSTTLLAIKLATLGDPVYWAISATMVLYTVGILSSASTAAATFRRLVELRFENAELVDRLRIESDIATTARIEAEDANKAKTKFLAAASHDLRQPIHAQGLFLEVLARGELSAQQREVLANARAACSASGEMLNTLLDFSRLEAGVVAVNVHSFRLQSLLNKLEAELAPQADEKDIVYRMRETALAVESDPVLVELILRNLVSNAIRYTRHGGLLIGCRRRGSTLAVEVWDTGIGIPAEHQREIFRDFHQLANPERDRRQGLGLGLAIAQRLAAMLGHDLSLTSNPGRGSRFALLLPLARAPVLDAETVQPAEEAPGTLDLRVLVIDDDEAVRTGMQLLLRSWGARCAVTATIDEALAFARREPPQLVICDYRLRDPYTGAEAIAALRADHRDLPAILITGDTAPERLREALASGLLLLHKPVSPADLHRAIGDTLEHRATATSALARTR
jgi:signal transduction histidine kinase/ActR/RegA family two-component response regulator